MKLTRNIFIGLLIFWLLTIGGTFYVTKLTVKPERVMVIQEKEIVKWKNQVEIQKIKEEEQYLIRIPFTEIGITKQFTIGTAFGYILKAVL